MKYEMLFYLYSHWFFIQKINELQRLIRIWTDVHPNYIATSNTKYINIPTCLALLYGAK